jgi:hypothetical protein
MRRGKSPLIEERAKVIDDNRHDREFERATSEEVSVTPPNNLL